MISLMQIRKLAKEVYPNTEIGLIHLLIAWAVKDPEMEMFYLLKDTGIDNLRFIKSLEEIMGENAKEDKELLNSCVLEISEGPVTGRDILKKICKSPNHRITMQLVKNGLNMGILFDNLEKQDDIEPASVLEKHGLKVDTNISEIKKYGRDLLELAKEGNFDNLFERPELEKIFEILMRKEKGNAVITGPSGVGKTALVELFARKLFEENVPSAIKGKKLFEIRMSKIVAGTKYRGEFEQRMENIIKALQDLGEIIIFIDEMHLVWGAGRAEGVITDASNILKPYLTNKQFQVIGSTTVKEYQRYIAQDDALARRFEEIRIVEPEDELIFKILKKQATSLEKHHKVIISEDIIKKSIELTNRYMPNRYQPDKTIDLLDRSSVSAIRNNRNEVNILDLRKILDVSHYSTNEYRDFLRKLPNRLKSRIIGQDHAIDRVVSTIIHRHYELGDSEKNLATFIFAGDTGIGKTELARSLSIEYFNNPKALIHIDLAEYNQPGSVNKLIGSPAGYSGSEKEGVLIEWLHTYGRGVILFDEIEKAYIDIKLLLLGLLDNGRITSALGKTMNTRQCIIILTTNAITSKHINMGKLGFKNKDLEIIPDEILENHFPREFIGRIDEVILFNSLSDKDMKDIIKLKLNQIIERINKKNLFVSYEEEKLIDFILKDLNLKNKSGARGLIRIIERKFLQPISIAILNSNVKDKYFVKITEEFYKNGKIEVKENFD